MVWVIAFGELFFGDLWCVVWGYGGMRTHFSLLNPVLRLGRVGEPPGFLPTTPEQYGRVARTGKLGLAAT